MSSQEDLNVLSGKITELEKYVNDCLRSVGAIIKKNDVIESDNKQINASFKDFVNSFTEFKNSLENFKENKSETTTKAAIKAEDVLYILDDYFEKSEFDKQIKMIVHATLREQELKANPKIKNKDKKSSKAKTLVKFFLGIFIFIAIVGFSYKIWSINRSYLIELPINSKMISLTDKKEYLLKKDLRVQAKIITVDNKKYYEFNYEGSIYRVLLNK